MKYYKFGCTVKNPLHAVISNFFQVVGSVFWFWSFPSEPHRTNSPLSNEIKLEAVTLKNIPLMQKKVGHIREPLQRIKFSFNIYQVSSVNQEFWLFQTRSKGNNYQLALLPSIFNLTLSKFYLLKLLSKTQCAEAKMVLLFSKIHLKDPSLSELSNICSNLELSLEKKQHY